MPEKLLSLVRPEQTKRRAGRSTEGSGEAAGRGEDDKGDRGVNGGGGDGWKAQDEDAPGD